ncbi:MAG: peptidoglycan-binding protein [Defluviitaleaceae bacterium]|nr:peptidoglycan-binding protein [Defluviitaleaceae bacterium]
MYWNIRDNISLPPGDDGEVVPPLPPQPPVPPPPGGIPPYPGQLIRVGSRGANVERIQRCLNSVRGRFPSIGILNVDGIFGPITEASVREFQRLFGLNPDGIVGPLTWGALMPECYGDGAGNPPPFPGFLIRQGARGDYVRQIQSCLNSVNHAGLATDGIFGPLTDAAVRNYQRANALAVDGIVGPITWGHLMSRCGIVPVEMSVEVADCSVMGIECSPNFAATDDSEREFMQETIGTVEPAKAAETVGVEMLTLPQVTMAPVDPPSTPVVEERDVDMHKFLMYLLVKNGK